MSKKYLVALIFLATIADGVELNYVTKELCLSNFRDNITVTNLISANSYLSIDNFNYIYSDECILPANYSDDLEVNYDDTCIVTSSEILILICSNNVWENLNNLNKLAPTVWKPLLPLISSRN